jgi:hypothetical protein
MGGGVGDLNLRPRDTTVDVIHRKAATEMIIKHALDIRCAPGTVWYWLATPERALAWQTGISTTEILESTPNVIGTTFRETVGDATGAVELRGVVTDYREDLELGMHVESKYNAVDVRWLLEDRGEYTRLTVRSNVRFKGPLWLISLAMRPNFKRKLIEQLTEEQLRRLCESGQR